MKTLQLVHPYQRAALCTGCVPLPLDFSPGVALPLFLLPLALFCSTRDQSP